MKQYDYDDLYTLYLKGYSLSQLAKIAGVTRQAIYAAFRRRSWVMRGKAFKIEKIEDKI
jgi:predicted DNA-binding protein YlxM (UPF0122 family)